MDCAKVGKLIKTLRAEKGLTQKQLADGLNLSDRTVSKWERGLGCPDVSLLNELSRTLGVDVVKILSGELDPSGHDEGNMNRIKFYLCPACGNALFGMDDASVSCCGRRLAPLDATSDKDGHGARAETVEDDWFVTIEHEMSKEHYITFAAYVCYDRVLFIKLYPEQPAEIRFPKRRGGSLFVCCNKHGLWKQRLYSDSD